MKKFQKRIIYLGLILAIFVVSTFVSIKNTEGFAPGGGGGGNYTMTFYGYVKDSSGTKLSGAKVVLKELEWGISKTVYSGSTGYYSVTISVYSYIRFTLTVSKSGYDSFTSNYYSPGTYRRDVYLDPDSTHTFSCYGFVIDDFTGLKLSGATVTLTSPTPGGYSSSKTTGSNGYYSFYLSTSEDIKWTVQASKNGFITKSAQVESKGYKSVDFILDRIPTPVVKYAVVVGISDYKAMVEEDDLEYCDEDATDWYHHLSGFRMDYYDHIWVYGDSNSSNYPQYDGLATEYNVKQALQNMVNLADSNDKIAFITAGHGGGDGQGSSYLCMWDSCSGESGEDGNLTDTELAAILENAIADKIFVFLDNCFSGGFGLDLMNMDNSAHVYCTTTCTESGFGIGSHEYKNGKWTYFFLKCWINNFESSAPPSMEEVFTYAYKAYPKSDEVPEGFPQEFDGNTNSFFYPN